MREKDCGGGSKGMCFGEELWMIVGIRRGTSRCRCCERLLLTAALALDVVAGL